MGIIIKDLYLLLDGNTTLNKFEESFVNLCYFGSPEGDTKRCKPSAFNFLNLGYFIGVHYPTLLLRQYNLEDEYGIKLAEVVEYYQNKFRAPEMNHNQNISKRGFDLVPFSSRQQFKKIEKLVESEPYYLEFHEMIK